MSSDTDINELYRLVIRRVVRPEVAGREPFVWEIQDKETALVLRSGAATFATMEEAHRSGLSALARLC
jgi:hypothetical protein